MIPATASAPLQLPPLAAMKVELGKRDPSWWVGDRLGEHVWSKQREILESVRDNRRTAVHSCHNTGKSFIAARVAAWWIETHDLGKAFVVTSAPTAPQVRAILWREIGRAHVKGKLSGRTNQTEWHLTPPGLKEEMVAYGRKPADLEPDAFQGIHAPYVLVLFDESCGMPKPLWEAADSLISNEGSKFLAIGNPDDPNTEFAEVCKPGSGWNVIGINAFDTPNFTGEEIPSEVGQQLISVTWQEEKLRKWGESNPLYISKVLGEFPETTEDGLIPMTWIKAAQERELEPGEPVELGVDVGGGGDKSIVALRQGSVVRIRSRDQNPDTMQTCGNVIAALKDTGATVAKVDEIGIGRGVVDRGKEQGEAIEGVNVGSAAPCSCPKSRKAPGHASDCPRTSFANLRAFGYWKLRERFQDGDMDIDAADDDLAAQLVDLKFKRTSSGKIQMESKDEIKRRGKPSPDEADAIMLAFIEPQSAAKVSPVWGRARR